MLNCICQSDILQYQISIYTAAFVNGTLLLLLKFNIHTNAPYAVNILRINYLIYYIIFNLFVCKASSHPLDNAIGGEKQADTNVYANDKHIRFKLKFGGKYPEVII